MLRSGGIATIARLALQDWQAS